MKKQSAGILLYKLHVHEVRILLVHPGGPYFIKKDMGAWSLPKGEVDEGEDMLAAAIREFKEETGYEVSGEFTELKPVKQKSGKVVYAWALQGDIDAANINSNSFVMEWPPKSSKMATFPEIDKAGWFTIEEARQKIAPYQAPFIDELANMVKNSLMQ